MAPLCKFLRGPYDPGIHQQLGGTGHPDVAEAGEGVARALMLLQRFDEATRELERAIAIYAAIEGFPPERSGLAHKTLAEALIGEGRTEQAIATCRKARSLFDEKYGPRNMWHAKLTFMIALQRWELHQRDVAKRDARAARALYGQLGDSDSAGAIDAWLESR